MSLAVFECNYVQCIGKDHMAYSYLTVKIVNEFGVWSLKMGAHFFYSI